MRKFMIIFILIFNYISLFGGNPTPISHLTINPNELIIVSDDNYPPYIFRDSHGNLQGIIVEQWNLWEQVTGIKVRLIAMDWGKAKQFMSDKKADVIETIFYNPERAKIYDFTKPYSTLNVPVFFQKNLSGITKISDLKGFTVGVKSGDDCINQLKKAGITSLQEYPSYEEIIKAAQKKSLYIFCIDEPPAMYYLYKYNIENEFLYGFNLSSGQFHRAVHKGNRELLSIIEEGFSQISTKDYDYIDKKWKGKKLKTFSYTKYSGYIILIFLIILFFLVNQQRANQSLKSKILERTSELERALSDLKEIESRNRALLNANPDFMFLFSEDGYFLDYKAPESSQLYTPPELFINQNVKDVLPENIAQITLEKIKIVIETHIDQNYEYILQINDKTEYFDARMVACGEKEILAIIRNITEKKQAEEERSRANKLDSIGILAGGIAHDFNNILTAILGSLSLIKIKTTIHDSTFYLLDEAEKACFRAKNLTGQLLTFAKGGAPVKASSDINEIIKESAEFVLRGSSCSCSYFLDPNLAKIEVDKGQISQVIQNLVINSAQAMPTGGIIKIFSNNINIPINNVLLLNAGNYIQITIKDEGVGIESNNKKYIFDPYFTTKQQGSGLGLTICYSIIKNHYGVIDVMSKTGEGSTFTIYLPTRDQKELIKPENEERNFKMVENKTILFMDDELQIRIIGGEILSYLGFKVDFAEDGEKALEKIELSYQNDQPYDLVIMDLTVPGKMGGKEAIKKIQERHPELKAIVTSGYSNDPVMSEYLKYGFSGVIVKPFDITAIENAVNKVFKD